MYNEKGAVKKTAPFLYRTLINLIKHTLQNFYINKFIYENNLDFFYFLTYNNIVRKSEFQKIKW